MVPETCSINLTVIYKTEDHGQFTHMPWPQHALLYPQKSVIYSEVPFPLWVKRLGKVSCSCALYTCGCCSRSLHKSKLNKKSSSCQVTWEKFFFLAYCIHKIRELYLALAAGELNEMMNIRGMHSLLLTHASASMNMRGMHTLSLTHTSAYMNIRGMHALLLTMPLHPWWNWILMMFSL